MGPKWRKYFPIVGTIFFFILISNLMGLIPGLARLDEQRQHHLGLGDRSPSSCYQYVGIREHGFGTSTTSSARAASS